MQDTDERWSDEAIFKPRDRADDGGVRKRTTRERDPGTSPPPRPGRAFAADR